MTNQLNAISLTSGSADQMNRTAPVYPAPAAPAAPAPMSVQSRRRHLQQNKGAEPEQPAHVPDAVLNMAAKHGGQDRKPFAYVSDANALNEHRDRVRRKLVMHDLYDVSEVADWLAWELVNSCGSSSNGTRVSR